MTLERFTHPKYLVRKKFFRVLGGAFHVYNGEGRLVFYSEQKALKLREDIRLFSDESMAEEILSIQARNIVDFSAAYDVIDTASGQKLGALKRRGLSSLIRDRWIIMDADDREIGQIVEDSTFLALLRRTFLAILPQSYRVEVEGEPAAVVRQRFTPFILKLDVDFTPDTAGRLDRRLGLAAAVLLSAIEGRQRE